MNEKMRRSLEVLILSTWCHLAVSFTRTTTTFAPFGTNLLPRDRRTSCHAELSTSGMWNAGLSYGKGPFRFYKNFKEWIAPFPQEDKDEFPEIFNIPKGAYEISLRSPLGIVFEEIEAGGGGLYVTDLVEGGNAERQGVVEVGDILIGISAVKVVGAKWERRLIPTGTFDFETLVGAITSNDVKWGCEDVVLQFKRPGAFEEHEIDAYLEFFEPPSDSVWRM